MSTLDDILQLQQPLMEGGIRSVNFFNGRLLTGKDLSREQAARREADARLGLALGSGVAFGLDVARDADLDTASAPVLRISAGLALNRLGQTLRLAADTSVALTRRFDAVATAPCHGGFTNCAPLADGVYVAGAGVYLLSIAPAQSGEGRAPTNGLDPGNVRCNTDANVEALQFRLIALAQPLLAGLNLSAPSLRNELAYRCFGAGVRSDWFAALPTGQARGDDLLESLRELGLGDQEVPLALLYMVGSAQIEFIDMWSVRRTLHHSESVPPGGLVETRRQAVGQAMFRQFQAQLAGIGPPFGGLGAVTARSHFRYLPAVGMVPVAEETDASNAEATRFFAGLSYRGPAFINAARLESLVRESLHYPPIDTQSDEFIWLYRVRENRSTIELGGSAAPPRSYVVFASGHLPYRADAQFDTAHWNYSNYALVP